MGIMTYERFVEVLNNIPFEPEFEIYLRNCDDTYMVIKYENRVSFQKCGDNVSGEEYFDDFNELYNAQTIAGVCLRERWNDIQSIVVNSSFHIPEDLDELYDVYGIK